MTTKHLSSDILERQFGPAEVKILHQDDATRIIETVATNSGRVLEVSLVRFVPEGVRAFPEIHAAIASGKSMGKAFHAAGVEFDRHEQFACLHKVPPAISQLFGAEHAVIVSVVALVGPNKTPYARITETYTGDVDWPDLFGQVTQDALDDIRLLAERTSEYIQPS